MRIENWDIALGKYILECAPKAFEYGVCDCVIFASDAVLLMTGIDPMLEGRGQYSNMRDGAMLIKKHRGSYEGIMDFYFERIENIRKTQRGDIVLKQTDEGPAYGVCWNGKGYFKKDRGYTMHHLSDCEIAWRVE